MSDHGSRATYQRGCRCLPCRSANAAYRPRRRRGGLVFAHAARAHLLELQQRGIGVRQAAKLAGLSMYLVHQVRSGDVEQIGAETANRLLAVKPIPALGALVPSWPCRRLLVHLEREGYTSTVLRARYGLSARTRPGRPVRALTAAKVLATHRLVMAEDPCESHER